MTWSLQCRCVVCVALVFPLCLSAAKRCLADVVAISEHSKSLADLSDRELALLREYKQQYDKLESFYGNARIEGAGKYYELPRDAEGNFPPGPAAKLVLASNSHYAYAAKDSRYFRLEGSLTVEANKEVVSRIACVTPTESLLLGIDTQTHEPYLISHGSNTDEYMSEVDYYWYHIAPYSLETQRLRYVLFHERDDLVVQSVTEDEIDDRPIVRIRTRIGNFSEGRADYDIQLDKSLAWAVSAINCAYYDPHEASPLLLKRQRCTYEGEVDGIPLLKEATFTYVKPQEGGHERVTQKRVFTISQVDSAETPLTEFNCRTLLKYEIGEVNEDRRSYFLIGLTIGIIFLLLGLILRRKATAG